MNLNRRSFLTMLAAAPAVAAVPLALAENPKPVGKYYVEYEAKKGPLGPINYQDGAKYFLVMNSDGYWATIKRPSLQLSILCRASIVVHVDWNGKHKMLKNRLPKSMLSMEGGWNYLDGHVTKTEPYPPVAEFISLEWWSESRIGSGVYRASNGFEMYV